MSVEVTTLKSGINVVTERCRISRPPRSASGSPPAAATSAATSTAFRISSNTWRSRARSGAARARSPRRSRRSAAISTPRPSAETTAYYARVLKADVPLALDVLADILSEPTFDARGDRREQSVIVQEIGAVADTPDDLVFEHLNAHRFPGPAARPLHPRHRRRQCGRFDGGSCATISARNYRAPDMRGGRGRRRRSRGGGGRGRAALCELHRARRAR